MIPCSWKQTFGIDCPTCGAQTSFLSLLKGNFIQSIKEFPALIPLLSSFLLAFLLIINVKQIKASWVWKSFLLSAIIIVINLLIKLFY